MANLSDVVRDAIVLSQELSTKYNNNFYTQTAEGFLQIDLEALSQRVVDHLKAIDSPIKEIMIVRKNKGYTNNNLYGVLKIDNGIAYIFVNGTLNNCWSRFTICKEILQLYIDYKDQYQQGYPKNHIVQQITELFEAQEEMFRSPRMGSAAFQFPDDVSNELTSIIMAADLIFPNVEKTQVDKLFKNKVKYIDIASKYMMPEFIVKTYEKNLHEISIEIQKATAKI